MKIIVLSCNKYKSLWKPFFSLLDKYYPNHPKCYLVCETEKCKYCETINVNSEIWTKRFRQALEQIDDDKVLVMLDDFFIRQPVNQERINNIKLDDNTACYNFELEYREPAEKLDGWDIQKNNQIYLTSTQPSLWRKDCLISLLKYDMSPWEFETQVINSPYVFYINNKDYIIDIGYRHQPLNIGWGITRGKLTKECKEFLEQEELLDEEIINNYPLL